MKHKIFSLVLFSIFWLTQGIYAQTKISSKEAARHVKDTMTVCGKVYSIKVIPSTGMVLLNIGDYYPNQDLTVVIKASIAKQFIKSPSTEFNGCQICITGVIATYKGKPEIIIIDPKQIKKS